VIKWRKEIFCLVSNIITHEEVSEANEPPDPIHDYDDSEVGYPFSLMSAWKADIRASGIGCGHGIMERIG